MPKENNKIVIVVGAGASADFQPENFRFPSGEALIKMIGNPRKIFDIFGNEILDEIYKDVIFKIDWNDCLKKGIRFKEINIDYKKNVLKYFFEYLKNPIYQNQKNSNVNFFSFDNSLGDAIDKYFDKIGSIKSMYNQNSKDKSPIKAFSNNEDFLNFIKDPDVRTLPNNNSNEIGRNFLNDVLRVYFKIEISKEEDISNRVLIKSNININSKNLPTLFENILKISNSRYLQISSLVNYYQPFSIDELLDSIKREKIDVLKPLKIEEKDLKAILKSDEQDQKKLEEQFRNELIDAGKTLIALFLLRSEKKDLFDNSNPEINMKIWYRHIRNLIINSAKNAKEIKEQIKNFTIISFNYDRSLDYYLRTRLSDYYNEIKERIIYPYGKLADDDWDVNEYGSFDRGGNFNPYKKDELEKIKKLGQGLRVIGELDQENINSGNVNLQKAYNLRKDISNFEKYCNGIVGGNKFNLVLEEDIGNLKQYKNQENNPDIKTEINFIIQKYQTLLALYESHKIYFLGFAFHQQNCDLLQLENFKFNKEIYWTNYDDSISINRKIENIFGDIQFDKKRFYPSIKKGVYDALIHDFKLEFE